ncbi:hypothetical protein GGI19_003228 [Coemansia pectinata]|uniref:Inositol polyphosphate-related phosphatase domain-containing protein n=1 Tax=Coemansia pectinata TaxID=1052879 RepID=A0A9W8H170_9FUNG|nr:hypothetical protein GGI19_003228 [Coemansia pectinata]
MTSDGDDSPPPKTLAERIARLGLEKEASARPSLRASTFRQPLSTGTEEADSEEPLFSTSSSISPPSTAAGPKPPTGSKPRIAAKPQLVRGPNAHTAALAQHASTGGALGLADRRAGSSSTAAAASAVYETSDYELETASVQQRVQSLQHTQPIVPGSLNPFASPEMPTCFEQSEDRVGPGPGPPPPVPVLRRSSSSISRLPLPPPPPLPSAPIERSFDYSSSTGLLPSPSTRHASLGVAAGQHIGVPGRLPLPPPPPLPNFLPQAVSARVSTAFHPPPTLPPKPTNIGTLKSPVLGLGQQGLSLARGHDAPTLADLGSTVPRGASLPPPPPLPPMPLVHSPLQSQFLMQQPPLAGQGGYTNAHKRASFVGSSQPRVSHSLPPPPPPPPPPIAQAQTTDKATTHSSATRQQSTGHGVPRHVIIPRSGSVMLPGGTAAASTARTALDFSSDLSLRPAQPNYRLANRRPPTLGAKPFLSLETATTAVISCLGGHYSVVVHQSRVMCTRVETGEICAIHNAPGPEERFTSIAPVQAAGDPTTECGRVWACTSLGRVMVLNTSNTGSYQEALQTSSHATIICMLPSGVGEIWTLRDDGLVEVWRDRSVDAALEQPLVPLRKFSIATELQAARRVANQRTMLLLYQREMWFAGSRSIWVYDTHTSADPAVSASSNGPLSTRPDQPLMVAHLSLTAHDAPITCIASNVSYLDEARIDSRGYVFSGTDAGHIVVWKASDYERWRTIDMSNGEPDVRITSLVCVSDRWLWVGFASGKIAVLDIGPEPHPTAAQCPLTLGLQDGASGAVQRRDTMWIVAKEWVAAESAVTCLHVDWSSLLTDRQRVQVASVHANGSVYYWDGSLAVDCQYNELRRRTPDFAHVRDVTVQINSWNIDAIKPEVLEKTREDQHFLRSWLGALGGQQMPDIIVIGLQEVVDLESKKMTAKSLWKNTTSKSKPKGKTGTKPAADISKRYGLWRSALEKALSRGTTFSTAYRAVECQNMVGLFICVFARDDIYRSVREVDVSHVKTGMGGLHGNKGGIGIRFVFEDTSFCFVNAHLAAGESARNNIARIEHCATIVKSLSFKRPMPEYQSLAANGLFDQQLQNQSSGRQAVSPTADLANLTLDAYVDGGDGQKFLDHAACFFSGDLNFRLGLSRQQVERYLDMNDLDTLLQFDQLLPMITLGAQPKSLSSQPSSSNLRSESSTPIVAPSRVSNVAAPYEDSVLTLHNQARSSQSSSAYSSGDEEDGEGLTSIGSAGFALRTFREMPILFRPTYKYDPGTDTYDTSEKRRVPAWCDRVLFRGGSGQLQARPQHGNIDSQQQMWSERFGDYDLQGQISPLIYQRLETRQSDHRPIVAAFRVKTKTIDREARRLASVDVRNRADTKTLAEMSYFAKLLWLSRYTASMGRASELLAATSGDLPSAIHSFLSS